MTAHADTEDLAEHDQAPDEDTGRRLTRGVRWTGLALGAALITYLYSAGTDPRIPGIPEILGLMTGFLLVAVLIMAATTAVAWLLRWHHRDIAAWSWARGRRATRWGYGHGRHHGGRLLSWLAARAAVRWQARHGDSPGAGTGDDADAPELDLVPRIHPEVIEKEAERRVCVACGNPEGGKWGPLVTYRETAGAFAGETYLIHQAHLENMPAGSPGRTDQEGQQQMENTTRGPRERARDRGRRTAATAAEMTGAAWRQLIAATADYEPEDDTALLDWMAGEATGMAAYAEAITDAYDTAVSGVGLDPVPLAALHDYADAAAACAEAMAAARTKFAGHYEQVRAFAAAGGLLPHDGRWITGEGT